MHNSIPREDHTYIIPTSFLPPLPPPLTPPPLPLKFKTTFSLIVGCTHLYVYGMCVYMYNLLSSISIANLYRFRPDLLTLDNLLRSSSLEKNDALSLSTH